MQILGEYDDENDALEHEFEVVDSMPELTNIRPGGEGRRLKPEEIAEREEARYKRIIQRKRDVFISTREKHEVDRRERFLSNPAYKRHQAEVEAWLERTRPEAVTPGQVSVKKRKNGRGFVSQLSRRGRPMKMIACQKEAERQAKLDDAAVEERRQRIQA